LGPAALLISDKAAMHIAARGRDHRQSLRHVRRQLATGADAIECHWRLSAPFTAATPDLARAKFDAPVIL